MLGAVRVSRFRDDLGFPGFVFLGVLVNWGLGPIIWFIGPFAAACFMFGVSWCVDGLALCCVAVLTARRFHVSF